MGNAQEDRRAAEPWTGTDQDSRSQIAVKKRSRTIRARVSPIANQKLKIKNGAALHNSSEAIKTARHCERSEAIFHPILFEEKKTKKFFRVSLVNATFGLVINYFIGSEASKP